MTITEFTNGGFQKREQPDELRYIFFGDVVKKGYTYYQYCDSANDITLTPKEYREIMEKCEEIPVRITACRFVYKNRFFKTPRDTYDTDLILGAIVEKERRKTAREAKLREAGRKARTEGAETKSSNGELEWWKALGVPRNATREQIARAYRDLMTGCHPDKVAHLSPRLREVAETEAKKLNAAREAALRECDRR
jgi:hypothetical protein